MPRSTGVQKASFVQQGWWDGGALRCTRQGHQGEGLSQEVWPSAGAASRFLRFPTCRHRGGDPLLFSCLPVNLELSLLRRNWCILETPGVKICLRHHGHHLRTGKRENGSNMRYWKAMSTVLLCHPDCRVNRTGEGGRPRPQLIGSKQRQQGQRHKQQQNNSKASTPRSGYQKKEKLHADLGRKLLSKQPPCGISAKVGCVGSDAPSFTMQIRAFQESTGRYAATSVKQPGNIPSKFRRHRPMI